MKKYIIYALLAIGAIIFIYLCIPKSCTKKIEGLERKSEKSLIIDSIISAQTEKHNAELDSIILIQYKKDSIAQIKAKSLTKERNQLLAIVRGFTGVRVDSIKQTVNDIPIAVYEAEMNANLICDTLLQFKDVQISIRDSIVTVQKIQIDGLNKVIDVKELSNKDLLALTEQLKKELKKARKANDILKVWAILATLANLVH